MTVTRRRGAAGYPSDSMHGLWTDGLVGGAAFGKTPTVIAGSRAIYNTGRTGPVGRVGRDDRPSSASAGPRHVGRLSARQIRAGSSASQIG